MVMKEIIELQLSFHEDAYPISARALRRFGSARRRSDYLKSVIESHFRALEENRPTQHEPRAVTAPREHGQPDPSSGLDAPDVKRTFSSYF